MSENPPQRPSADATAMLRVSRYDRASGLLIALLVSLGSVVAVMFLVWITSRIKVSQAAVPVVMEDLGTDAEGAIGGGAELVPPADNEVYEEASFEQPPVKDTLSLVAGAVQQRVDMLDDPERKRQGSGGGRGTGVGTGVGSGRGGRTRRWELSFPSDQTLEAYGRQLDYFGVELGVLMPGNRVEYAFNFSKSQPDRRSGPADQEKRYYLTWRQGELEQADRDLLARAGIEAAGHLILKFIQPPIEAKMAELERNKAVAASEDPSNVRTTYFRIKPEGAGYVLEVYRQSYKK